MSAGVEGRTGVVIPCDQVQAGPRSERVQQAGCDPESEVADGVLHAAVASHGNPEITGIPGLPWRRLSGGCAVVGERTSRWRPG